MAWPNSNRQTRGKHTMNPNQKDLTKFDTRQEKAVTQETENAYCEAHGCTEYTPKQKYCPQHRGRNTQ